jgi:hypothetical protein
MSPVSNTYWKLPLNAAELVDAVRWAAAAPLSLNVQAPVWVTAEPALQEATGAALVHLVNFRYDQPLTAVPVELRLPAGARVASVEVLSTDSAAASVPFQVAEGAVRWKVPRLAAYSLSVVRMQNR